MVMFRIPKVKSPVVIHLGLISLCCLLITSSGFAKIDLEKHLVGLWKFDEGKGGTAKDDSGNGLEGKLEGKCKWVKGKFGQAIEFDGKSGYVAIKEHANPTKAITVAALVKSAEKAWNNHGTIMSKRDAFIIHNNQGGTGVSFPICNGGCWNKPGAWRDGEVFPKEITDWHLYAGTFDSKTGEWRIVIDGKIESKLKLAKNEIAAEEAKQLWIGRDQCCGDRFGTITVDEAMVFDVALGEEELTEIYTNGIDGALAVNNRGKLTVSWGKVKVQ